MKPKNVMLLGFVNRAVEYLDEHMDEQPNTRLAELKNIDLASLKDELSDTIDTSLGTMQSTMATLLKAGNEAFDKFVEESNGKISITDEMDRLFDVDLDESKKDNQEELAKLLSFYNLDNDFEAYGDEDIETPISNNDENNFVSDYNYVSDDDDYLQEIIKNATSDQTSEVPVVHSIPSDRELDNIFTEIVSNEGKNVAEDANFKAETTSKNVEDEVIDEVVNDETIQKNTPKEIDEVEEKLEKEKAEQKEALEVINSVLAKLNADVKSNEIEKEETTKPVEKTEVKVESVVPSKSNEEAKLDAVVKSNETEKEETIEQAKSSVEKVEPVVSSENNEETKQQNSDSYLGSLITDLKKQLELEEAAKKEKEAKYKEVYERISKVYPYLSAGFIRVVYDLKDQLAKDYAMDSNVIVLHRVLFKDVDNLRKFVEIGLNHGYQINADEKKMIVDIFRQFKNSDGKILANIYEIANQGFLLGGEYDGYRVIVNE